MKITDEIKIQTLANVEDSMFGHDLLDVRINGLPLPINGDAFLIFLLGETIFGPRNKIENAIKIQTRLAKCSY